MLKPATMFCLVLLAGLHSSCAQRVDVGSVGSAIDLGACLGPGAQCDAGDVPRFTAAERSDDQTVGRCETSEDDSWHLDWWLRLDAVPCAPLGFCSPRETAIAADGSLWLAGVGITSVADNDESSLGGIFVAHYDAQGKLIAKRVIETAQFDQLMTDAQAVIAAQDGAEAVVVAHLDGETWVQRLDAQVQSVGPRVALTGVAEVTALNVSMHPSGGVYVSVGGSLVGKSGPTALARLDAELHPVWIRGTQLHTARFAPTHSNELPLIGITPDPQAFASIGHDLLVSYDERGNVTRELEASALEPFSIGTDGTIMLLKQSFTSPFPYEALELSAEGDVLERVEIADQSVDPSAPVEPQMALVSATTDRDGNSYFAHYTDTTDGRQGIAIVQRNADDGRCTKSIVAFEPATDLLTFDVNPQPQVWRSDDGALYVRFERGMVRLSR